LLSPAGDQGEHEWRGRVANLVYLGDKTEAYGEVGGGSRLIANLGVQDASSQLTLGDPVRLRLDPRYVFVL
jgi:TOBE domain